MKLSKSEAVGVALEYLPEIDSTNLELARRLAASELPDLYSIAAGSQTKGQGRLGRDWVSTPDSSLSLSMLFQKPKDPQLMPLFFAVATRRAVSAFHPGVQIKWPNDLLIDGQKVAGLLLQIVDQDVIAGVGVNLKPQAGTPETACSLGEFTEVSFDELLSQLLTEAKTSWERLNRDYVSEASAILVDYQRHCATIGTRVRAELPDGSDLVGMALEVTSSGRLVLDSECRRELSAADVWHLRN